MFYYIILIVIFITILLNEFMHDKFEKKIYIFWIIFLFIISAFRYETGNDWLAYERMLDYELPFRTAIDNFSNYYNYNKDIEIGYRLLNSIVKSAGGDLQTVFFITSLFSFISLSKFIKQYSNKKLISVIIYYSVFFLNFNMSIIRQGIALSIFLIALNYLFDRKFIKYILLILIATSFHQSAIVLIPVYFIYRLHFNGKVMLGTLLVFLLLRVINVDFITMIALFLPTSLMNYVFGYLQGSIVQPLLSFGTIERLVSSVLMIVALSFIKDKKLHFFGHLYIIYVILNFTLFKSDIILTRIRFYFQISYIVMIPILYTYYKKKIPKSVLFSLIFVFSFLPMYFFLSSNINKVLYNPYQNYIVHRVFELESTGRERYYSVINN